MSTKTVISCLLLGATIAGLSGCQYYARSQKDYRDDTAKVLAQKDKEVEACYDNVLKATPGVKGKVVVQFTVEAESGRILSVAAVPGRTNAPQPLIDCVTNSMNGLILNPPDQRTGIATFEYEFELKKNK